MAAPTYAQLRDAFLSAMLAVSNNQSYVISGRTYTRADLSSITATLDWLDTKIGEADKTIDPSGSGFVRARLK